MVHQPPTDLLPPGAKPHSRTRRGHRRRILERLSRISSSPQLSMLGGGGGGGGGGGVTSRPTVYTSKHAVSCISLYHPSNNSGASTPGGEPAIRVLETFETPYGADGETLRVSVPPRRREPREPRDCWGRLPDEVKVLVFGYLEPRELVRCSAVCKKWHTLCFDGQLWRSLDATGYYNRIPVDQLAKIVTTAGPFVKNLNLRGCVQLHNDWREEAVWNACRNLTTCSLEGCRLNRASTQVIIIRNPSLVSLNLSGLSTVTNSICKLISQSCFSLEHLNVSWCTGMDARGIKKIVEACKLLRELRANEVGGFDDAATMGVLFKTNNLERLHLGGCAAVNDEAVRILCEDMDPEVDPFTNRTLAPPRKLVHLNLSKCTRITDSALRSLADNIPYLEGLELGGCAALTDAGFAALIPGAGRLSHLDLEECAEVTNATLIALARGPAAKRLRSLGVSYCENISDAGVTEVVRKCVGLRNLEVDNTRITDIVLSEAAHTVRYRPFPMADLTQVPDSTSPRIALRLVVFDCASITWTGVRGILARNVESASNPSSPTRPDLIQLKCFYGWQQTFDAHLSRVLRGDLAPANRLETKWAEHMVSTEEVGSGGARRRRRRLRLGIDDDDFGFGGMGGFGVGRSQRRRVCVVS